MVNYRDRQRVLAAIARLISGSDPNWTASARVLLRAGIPLRSAGSNMTISRPRYGMPHVETASALYGMYVIEHMAQQHCIEVTHLASLNEASMHTHQLFYDETTKEPLVMLRVLKAKDGHGSAWQSLLLLHDWLWNQVASRIFSAPPRLTSVWVAQEARVVYSAVEEYQAGSLFEI